MTYPEVLEELYRRLPMFTRTGPAAYKPDLSNITQLLHLLGNPHHGLKYIHVAGTNGKGSTSHMLASVLQEAGYKTGLTTSPHLIDFRERIRINGVCIPEEAVVRFFQDFPDLWSIPCSFFEYSIALAFWWFHENKPDWVVVETGLGGRLDSTNVISPQLCLITNIGMDHADLLGPDLPSIAKEKAGIIKAGVPVIVNEKDPATAFVFEDKAKTEDAPLYWSEDLVELERGERSEGAGKRRFEVVYPERLSFLTTLVGKYQYPNIRGLIAAYQLLKGMGVQISIESLQKGMEKVIENTGLMGRWQVLQNHPFVIADTGHNGHAVKHLVAQLKEMNPKRLFLVWGMMGDKETEEIQKYLSELKVEKAFACAPNLPRAKSVEKVRDFLQCCGMAVTPCDSVRDAVKSALQSGQKDDMIFIGGSTFVVAEVLKGVEDGIIL